MTRVALSIIWLAASLSPSGGLPSTVAGRKAFLESHPPEEIGAIIRAVPHAMLLGLGRSALYELGIYSARMSKQERIKGKMLGAQVMAITVRERPQAIRMEVIDGPKKGRKVLYSEELRKGEFRVREAGLLGIKALWLDLDSGLAKRDTNHRVTELGFGPILNHLDEDMKKAAAHGGHQREDQGFDERGRWCLVFTAPPDAKDLYAYRTRMCLDLILGLPVELEVFDHQGLLERVEIGDVQPHLTPPAGFFTLEAAGL